MFICYLQNYCESSHVAEMIKEPLLDRSIHELVSLVKIQTYFSK